MYRIFISHLREDTETALLLKKQIEDNTTGVTVHVDETDIRGGNDWKRWIRETVFNSDLFILLHTDLSKSSEIDWLVYEAGIFTTATDDASKIVTLTADPEKLPPQINDYQAVKTEADDLYEKFYRPLFRDTAFTGRDAPLNMELRDSRMEELAEDLVESFESRELAHYYVVPTLRFEIEAQQAVDGIPGETIVTALTPVAFNELLNFESSEASWSEICARAERHRGHGTFWPNAVNEAVKLAADKSTQKVMTATFRSFRGGRIFRPVLIRADRFNESPRRYTLSFIEDFVPESVRSKGPMGDMFLLVRLAMRLRSEVLDPFINDLSTDQYDEDIFDQIRESIEAIEQESLRENVIEEQHVVPQFPRPEDRQTITEMFANWRKARETLGRSLLDRDAQVTCAQLKLISDVNYEFLSLSSQQLNRIVETDVSG